MQFLKRVPMALCGLILGLESLGNLLLMTGFSAIGNFLGIIGMLLMVLILVKVFLSFASVYQELLDPLKAGTLPTFTMALMLIAMYWQRWGWTHLALTLWLAAILGHLTIMAAFIWLTLLARKPALTEVYPSWFVMFVGLGVIPVSAKLFIPMIGQIFFWLALALYLFVFPIVFLRLFRHSKLPAGALPLLTIIAAPASLCLTGYLNSFSSINQIFAVALGIFAQFLYIATLVLLGRIYLSGRHSLFDFYPSFAAFTFPLVISATALTSLLTRLQVNSSLILLARLELIAAIIGVTYVLVMYLKFLSGLVKTQVGSVPDVAARESNEE